MGSCAAPSAKGDDKFITTDYLQQCHPFVISTVTPMSKNRLPLNIILTTAAAWRLPAEPWVIPALMCSLAGLMNFIPTDDVYLPVRPTRLCPLNQKSNVRLSWHSLHDKYQPVKSPGVLVSVARYCINYYSIEDGEIILLLIGGNKKTQTVDLDKAVSYLQDFKKRSKNDSH